MIRKPFVLLSAIAALSAGPMAVAHAGAMSTTWDKLVEVPSKTMQAVYLLPGADFRGYTKIMLDPTEVDFVKGWVRQTNENFGFAYGRTDDQDAKDIAKEVRKGFDKVFAEAFTKAGWQVVTEPAPDVLRLSTAVFNLSISAPSSVTMSAGASVRTVDAGQASVLIEARDSESGQVLGRALDVRTAGVADNYMARTPSGNYADFKSLFDRWAQTSVKGLAELKAISPVDEAGKPAATAAPAKPPAS